MQITFMNKKIIIFIKCIISYSIRLWHGFAIENSLDNDWVFQTLDFDIYHSTPGLTRLYLCTRASTTRTSLAGTWTTSGYTRRFLTLPHETVKTFIRQVWYSTLISFSYIRHKRVFPLTGTNVWVRWHLGAETAAVWWTRELGRHCLGREILNGKVTRIFIFLTRIFIFF